MAESLRGGLSLSASGFGFWSHGSSSSSKASPTRPCSSAGCRGSSSHSRLHGSDSYRVPWAFDEEAVDVTRLFTRLKLSLMPYLARLGQDAHLTGVPVMRPMVLSP